MTTASPSGIAATPRETAICRRLVPQREAVDWWRAYLEIVDSTFCPTSVRRVVEMLDVDEPNENTDDRDHLCKHVAEIIQLLLQGCWL